MNNHLINYITFNSLAWICSLKYIVVFVLVIMVTKENQWTYIDKLQHYILIIKHTVKGFQEMLISIFILRVYLLTNIVNDNHSWISNLVKLSFCKCTYFLIITRVVRKVRGKVPERTISAISAKLFRFKIDVFSNRYVI